MKTLRFNGMVFLFFLAAAFTAHGQQDQEQVPGDNFSLEGALELFKKSSSPEEFEKMLNSSDSKVNNLDLNGDGDIDYIKVIDKNEGNVHAFILQAVISDTERQDVAVIELEKFGDGKASLQIVGDADVYGMETIIEPTEEVRVNAGTSTARTVVNVWAWPSVQYVYSPYYTVWASPWGWSMRPVWWRPWRPVAFYVYDPWWTPYRPYYSVCYTHRIGYANRIYRPYRSTSVVVYNRHHTQIANYRSTRGDDYNSRGRSGYANNNRSNSRSDHHYNNGSGSRSSYSDRTGNNSTNAWRNRSSSNAGGRINNSERDNNSNGFDRSGSRNWSAERRTSDSRSNSNTNNFSQRSFSNQNQLNNRSGSFQNRLPNTSWQRTPSFNQGGNQRSNSSFQRGSSPRMSQPSMGDHSNGGGGNRSGGSGGSRGRH